MSVFKDDTKDVQVKWIRTWRNGERSARIQSVTVDGRKFVAIDPESVTDVNRLAFAYESLRDMGAALRSLLEPPRPEEPTGLGAVVKDSHGETYVRIGVHDDDGTWACVRTLKHFTYSVIPAPVVLSQGVPA